MSLISLQQRLNGHSLRSRVDTLLPVIQGLRGVGAIRAVGRCAPERTNRDTTNPDYQPFGCSAPSHHRASRCGEWCPVTPCLFTLRCGVRQRFWYSSPGREASKPITEDDIFFEQTGGLQLPRDDRVGNHSIPTSALCSLYRSPPYLESARPDPACSARAGTRHQFDSTAVLLRCATCFPALTGSRGRGIVSPEI